MKSVQLFTAYSLSLAPVFCGHLAHLRRLLLNLLPLLLYLVVKGGEWSLNEAGQMLFVTDKKYFYNVKTQKRAL